MNLPPAGGTDLGAGDFPEGAGRLKDSDTEGRLGICRPAFTFPGVLLVLEQTQGPVLRGLARTSGYAKKKKKKKANENKTQSLESLIRRRMGNSGHWATEQECGPCALAAEMTQWGRGAPGSTLRRITTVLCLPRPNLRRAQRRIPFQGATET